MLVGNHHSVKFLAALLRFLHVLDRLHARGFRAGTHAELVADLQPVNLREHFRDAGLRLENHLKTVELEAAVVFVSDVGKLNDLVVLGESARRAGVNRRTAARAGGKADGAELHAFAHHFFHRVQLFWICRALIGGFAHDRQAHRRVRHERQNVERDFAFEVVQIIAEGVPAPILVVDILVEHAAQVGDQDFARFRLRRHRGAGSAAVADHDAGDAVIDHRIAVRILHYEGVHVGVRIDEAGRHHMSFGVDFFLP